MKHPEVGDVEPRAPVPKARLFYGWVVTFAAGASFFLVAGARQGGFGNFLTPVSREFGWSRGLTAGAASLGTIEQAVQGPIIGILIDRFGSRQVMWVGFALASAGFVILSYSRGLALFYFVYVLIIPLGLGSVQLAGQTAVAQWFVRKRSRALSLVTVGFSIGGAVMTPSIGWMVEHHGWRSASLALGLIVGVVGLAVVSLVRESPEKHGLRPDGDAEPASVVADSAPQAPVEVEVNFTTREALSTRAFWLLTGALGLTQLATSAIIVHTIPLLIDRGFSSQAAANFLGLTFVWGILGRLVWGYLGDIATKRYLLAIALLIQGAGILILAGSTSNFGIQVFACLYGLGQAVVPVQFAIRGEYFGRTSFGSIAGMQAFFSTLGGVVGPVFAGRVFDLTGSYQVALVVVAAGCVVGALMYWVAQPPRGRESSA